MKEVTPESVTFWQVNNVIPVIVTFLGLTLSFAAWSARVSVLETKMDIVIYQQSQVLVQNSELEKRINTVEVAIGKLEY